MTKLIKKLFSTPKIFRNDSGAVAILFALFLGVFIPLLALVLDYGRAVAVEAAMANGADAGALAGATEGGDPAAMEAEARKYFAANMVSGQYVATFTDEDIKIEISDDAISVTPTATESRAYILTGKKGDFVAVSTTSAVSLPSSAGVPVDYYLILDESGSMNGSSTSPKTASFAKKNIALRHSVELMIDLLFTDDNKFTDPLKGHRMAMVSYSTKRTDITDITHDKNMLLASLPIHTEARGMTCASCAIGHALTMHDDKNKESVFIVMTDGHFNRSLNGGDPIKEAIAFCNQIKALPNTDIWTVGFGTSVSTAPLQACASAPEQFQIAETGLELGKFFEEVARQTGKVRIIQ